MFVIGKDTQLVTKIGMTLFPDPHSQSNHLAMEEKHLYIEWKRLQKEIEFLDMREEYSKDIKKT